MSDQATLSPPKPPAAATQQDKPRSRPKWLPLVVLAALGLLGYFGWRTFLKEPEVPRNLVPLSGRIEGDDAAVAPKTAGRVLELRVREGDTVNAGDVIAVLDDEQLRAREQAAQAALDQARARVRAAQAQIGILNEQVEESRLGETQSRTEAESSVRRAEAEVSAAEAELARQEAALKLAEFDRQAFVRLSKSGAVAEREGQQATANADTQAAVVVAARRRVESAKAAAASARANLTTPKIRAVQGQGILRQITQANAEIAAAQADAARATAQLTEAQANRGDLTVRAPFAGTVVTRAAEPGEVVTAGTPLVTLVDLNRVYLRGFVPEGQIGRVRVGQPARIYLDSAPNTPLEATVSRIDPQATFTPENTYFREDRVKQVVGVKLQLKAGRGFAKPGMPADGEVLVEGGAWPEGSAAK